MRSDLLLLRPLHITEPLEIIKEMRTTKKHRAHKNKSSLWIASFTLLSFIVIWGYFSLESNKYSQFDWTEIRPEIRDTALAVERSGELTGRIVGLNAHVSKSWERRQWLKKNANSSEIIKLLDHPNSAVKVTAYEFVLRQQIPTNTHF